MLVPILCFLLVFVLSLGIGLTGLLITDRRRRVRRARLLGLVHPQARAVAAAPKQTDRGQGTRGLTVMTRLGVTLAGSLTAAGLDIAPDRFALRVGIASVGLGVALMVVSGVSAAVVLPASLATGMCLAGFVLTALKKRRLDQFRLGLPDALDTIGRALRAGRTIADALGLVADGGAGLLPTEMDRCRSALLHGETLVTTLANLSLRVRLVEVHFLAAAVAMQAETGGNLAETVENMATSIRNQLQVDAKARALSAEVRVSAAVLTALPTVVGGLLLWINPRYMSGLYQDERGLWMLGYAVISVLTGLVMMKRMGRADD